MMNLLGKRLEKMFNRRYETVIIYVNQKAKRNGDGSKEWPFTTISQAAKIAVAGDEVVVAPGVYRENVDPIHGGTKDQPIVYRSEIPLGAVITGAEEVDGWEPYQGNTWKTTVKNGIFHGENPFATYVYGDWYFAGKTKHTATVYVNDEALYEAGSIEECVKGEIYPCSWDPEGSRLKWYAEVNPEETTIYGNFGGKDPRNEKVEINVRRNCFMPSKTGVSYIHVKGFELCKAATNWAPPAAFQDGMIGPHWSKGWIIEECDIHHSKCAGISLGKYYDPQNDHYFTRHHVKSPTQMERDAVCRGQYHGWTKETVGSHIIRKNRIHHCEQGGIIGRMGAVFSVIEDNHIHHINNMMELGGAEVAGIKLHAAIDVVMRRNHIHHCVMGIWTDWEAQGTRITENLLHHNQRPDYAQPLDGGMGSQDIFVEVSHGPTLIDHNILLSQESLRMATQGVAMVHNLICGSLTAVGDWTDSVVDGVLRQRYTPYHMHHRTEVMGFMTILHGDDRFYNNIFVQKWPIPEEKETPQPDHKPGNFKVGTFILDEYPTYEEWIENFDLGSDTPDMGKLASGHFSELPVWIDGNAYLNGAAPYYKEKHSFVSEEKVYVELQEIKKEESPEGSSGGVILKTNVFDVMKDFYGDGISSDTLGKAFEPEQRYENPDGTDITFDTDFFGKHRGAQVLPGPFADRASEYVIPDHPAWC